MKTHTDKLDLLTRQRLQRLGQVAVDTSNLKKRVEAAFWQQKHRPSYARIWSSRKLTGVAAVLLVAAGVVFFIVQGSTPVVAAPAALAQLHQQLVAGQIPTVQVSSIDQANRYVQTEWSEAPLLPDLSGATVTSCCRSNVQKGKVACVLMDYRNQRVTMMVGRSRDVVCGASHDDIVHQGRHYAVHESGGLQMVMVEHKGRWVCLTSHLSVNALIELADTLRFE